MGKKSLTKEIVNKRLLDNGRGIIITGEYVTTKTKTKFRCDNGHEWNALPNLVLAGNGCPHCANNSPLTKDIINQRLSEGDSGILLTGEYMTSGVKTKFMCDSGHEWEATPNNILKGSGCPYCSGLNPITPDSMNLRLLNDKRDVKLIGNLVNNRTKTKFGCSLGHEWETTPNSILNGTGCPFCVKTGFDPKKAAWTYILVFETYIKYGITNNLKRRLRQHLSNGIYTVANTKFYERGDDAIRWERHIKDRFGGRFVSREICPDGYTETLCISMLNDVIGEQNGK